MAVVKAVLVYGSDMWVLTPQIGRVLGRFHNRVDRILTVWQSRRGRDRKGLYPTLMEEVGETVLQLVETYDYHRHNIVTHIIATRPITDLCLAAERHPGS